MPTKGQNWLRRFKNEKMLKFNNIFLTDESPVDKENSSLKSDVYGLN